MIDTVVAAVSEQARIDLLLREMQCVKIISIG
jgi:hypothetical protein